MSDIDSMNMQGLHWLMQMLSCPKNPKFQAFPILFPDTVFYKNSKATELVRTNPETGFLETIKEGLNWYEICI